MNLNKFRSSRLVKFQVMDIQPPMDRPYIHLFKTEYPFTVSEIPQMGVEKMVKSSQEKYEAVRVMDAEGAEHLYWINFDEIKHAIPIIDGIVNNQARIAEEKIRELRALNERLFFEKHNLIRGLTDRYKLRNIFKNGFPRVRKFFIQN